MKQAKKSWPSLLTPMITNRSPGRERNMKQAKKSWPPLPFPGVKLTVPYHTMKPFHHLSWKWPFSTWWDGAGGSPRLIPKDQAVPILVLPKENVCAPSWPPNMPSREGLIHRLLSPAVTTAVAIRDGQGMEEKQESRAHLRNKKHGDGARTLRDSTSSVCKEVLGSYQQPPEAQEAFTAKSLVRQWLGTQTSTSGSKVLGKHCPALHTRPFVGWSALKTFLFSPK